MMLRYLGTTTSWILAANILLVSTCQAQNFIGCLFSQTVCDDAAEWCYNDYAFGRCLPRTDNVEEKYLYRHELDRPALHALSQEMYRLFSEGYRWTHAYTQCVLQALLEAIQFGLDYKDDACTDVVDMEIVEEKVDSENGNNAEPEAVAYVKFTPSASNPHAEFADEVYFPQLEEITEPEETNGVAKKSMDQKDVQTKFLSSLFGTKHRTPRLKSDINELPLDNPFHMALMLDGQQGQGFTEGGVVSIPTNKKELEMSDALDDGLDDLLSGYTALERGFKRRERLDVKKPGPQFRMNNYAFQKTNQNDAYNTPDKKKFYISDAADSSPVDSAQYDVVDTSYAYVGFRDSINTWDEGTQIVDKVAELLNLEPKTLTHIRVDRNEVTFKVEPNSKGINASELAKSIESIKGQLKSSIGVEVTSAGIGDKTKLPSVLQLAPDSLHELYLVVFVVCSLLGVILIAFGTLVIIRKHSATHNKLSGLTTQPDTEASKDYQDLCRARMATKGQQEKPEPLHAGQGQRITSLSRESEGSNHSPSSRSSTSSWSEEPALTNMDISTGHVVLSYMEDHLKNKDRLEQEWVALCAYEAEPSSTNIAKKPENVKKNRYMEYLPYDHSRVVLNDLANISGSDYINASTITDHDPRNPAYIATQGPLPNTAPDFWQMVWEQGSVVMVMLTRLTENGHAMCHRYWPEEGSELYHIYEVHLVSEHIWCDDYLVRSFYLKNLKTGETRTVTQFHFLSWPNSGVPLSIKALLEFRRKVNKSYRGRSCPIVVHCSDGVGRTGTYCLIDMVLNRMAKGAKEIDIAATLEHIRDQRPQMVKTKQQFEFVLMAVAEEVHAILKALPSQTQPQL